MFGIAYKIEVENSIPKEYQICSSVFHPNHQCGIFFFVVNKNSFLQMPNIKLQSSDGEVFEVDVDIAKCSVTIKTMLEDLGMDEDEEEVVPLPNVNSAILRKVIQWATYHKDDPPPPEDDENKEKRTDDISSWDADFLKVKLNELFQNDMNPIKSRIQ